MLKASAKRLEHRSILYRQWASLLESGVPMVRALGTLARGASRGGDQRLLRRTAQAIEKGASLDEGLARSGRRLPALDRALIKVGERTGRLDHCLVLLADTTQHQARLVRDIAGGLAYPVLVLHVALLVFPITALQELVLGGALVTFVLTKLRVFAILYAVLFLIGWLSPRLFGGQSGRAAEAGIRLVPALGRGLRDLALARLAITLRAQLDAGIPVIEAWGLAAEVCGSPSIRGTVRGWPPALERGATPGELATASRAIDPLFSEFYLTGETSGKLDDALVHVERVYDEAGRARLKAFAIWLPRMVYGAIVVYVAYVVITFWSNYFARLGTFISP